MTSSKEVVVKSWDTRDIITVIKEVANKGEFVELCIEYVAKKRKIPLKDSKKFFHKTVDSYVNRLLSDKLVFKAEFILQNVNRDWKAYFYQFAYQSRDEQVQRVILEHLQKKDPVNFDDESREYEFYYKILYEIRKDAKLFMKVEADMAEVNLEELYTKDQSYKKSLVAFVYFNTEDSDLLDSVDKVTAWGYLVREKQIYDILEWCSFHQYDNVVIASKRHEKYKSWTIDKHMVAYAMEMLIDPPEILRNAFAYFGHIFPDERGNLTKSLQRMFTTESYDNNLQNLLKDLPIGKFLLENDLYVLILEDFVSATELEQLKPKFPDKSLHIDMTLCLKRERFDSKESIMNVMYTISNYLEKVKKSKSRHPLIVLSEVLLKDCTIDEVRKSDNFRIIKNLPYIDSLWKRLTEDYTGPNTTAYEMLKKAKNIDLHEINKETGDEPFSFSNSFLNQKYSQKFKLNYIHYLKLQRSSYAIYQFIQEQLAGYSQISKSQLFGSAEVVTELAVTDYKNDDIVQHSVAFIEMLGFDTQNLRSVIRILKLISQSDAISSESKIFNYSELIEVAERTLYEKHDQEFPLRDYDAIMQVSKCNQFKKWPEIFLNSLAEQDDWWRVLILVQYFDMPLIQMRKIFKKFKTPEIGDHLLRALPNEPYTEKSKRRQSFSRTKSRPRSDSIPKTTTSRETMTPSITSSNDPNPLLKTNFQTKFLQESEDLDLFALILLSTTIMPEEKLTTYQRFLEIIQDPHSYSTSLNLLKNSKVYELPILAVLAAVVNDLNLHYCWITWLGVSTRNFKLLESSKDVDEVTLRLIETSVKGGFTRTLNRSFQIFYKDNKFSFFTKFLQQTSDLNFNPESTEMFSNYLLAWSNEEANLPISNCDKFHVMNLTVRLLILHLKYNFESSYHQEMLLNIICQSGVNDISHSVDFCLLRNVFEIISFSEAKIDFEKLLLTDDSTEYIAENEYENLLYWLRDLKEYEKAIRLAFLLHLPLGDIVYAKWVDDVDPCTWDINFEKHEKETNDYSLAPEFVINFYLYVAARITEPTSKKYMLLKKALDVIKKNRLFPNECFDRDQIEYEMVLCYLQNDDNVADLELYHTEYFEEILQHERCVLYKSFHELKELAGVEDITTSMKVPLNENMKIKLGCLINTLLDEGDIVEALRLQAMFEYRPIDLHFIVFCMALAEGLVNIYELPRDERQLLIDVEKSSITKFDKRKLGRMDTSDFEEIPSREKQDILQALQGLASRLKYGVELGKRIIMVYRAAMYLDKEYLDVLRMKDGLCLLQNATEEECLQKLVVVSDIFTSTQMTQVEIAEYLSCEIATAIIRPRFYIFRSAQPNTRVSLQQAQNELWGYDLDKQFHLFLELCPNTTVLGNAILNYCDALKVYRKYQDNKDYENELEKNPLIENAFNTLREIIRKYGHPSGQTNGVAQVLSHKKQNTICVELLIKAHECFIHECSMEGIANVLSRTKVLNNILTAAKSWNLIVRMLTGIGRYREMYYCFDTLIKNEQFESLLGQFDEEKTNGLRHAIISYIREYCPQNQECLKLAALHFSMYKELAEMWEQETSTLIATIMSEHQATINENSNSSRTNDEKSSSVSHLKCSTAVLTTLNKILENLTHATENYLLDNKLRLANKSASNAELVAMQIDLVNKGISTTMQTCICVLNVRSKDEFRDLINTELRVPQAMILGRAYSYEINWPEAILSQYILLGRSDYLKEFTNQMQLTDSMIENIVKSVQIQRSEPAKMIKNMESLVELVQSVGLRYKLASLLGFKRIITTIINDQSLYYLKDTNYGRSDV